MAASRINAYVVIGEVEAATGKVGGWSWWASPAVTALAAFGPA